MADIRRRSWHRPPTLSGYGTAGEKIDAVLERFAGQNSYRSPNDLVEQLRGLEPESVGILLGRLDTVEPSDWAQQRAIIEALAGRIPVEYREQVISHFRKNGSFAEFIKRHRVSEIEAIAACFQNQIFECAYS